MSKGEAERATDNMNERWVERHVRPLESAVRGRRFARGVELQHDSGRCRGDRVPLGIVLAGEAVVALVDAGAPRHELRGVCAVAVVDVDEGLVLRQVDLVDAHGDLAVTRAAGAPGALGVNHPLTIERHAQGVGIAP